MSKKIYPSGLIESTVEYHLAKNTIKSQVIYIIIILVFFIAVFSLPFIYVNVTIQGSGIVRPITEKTEIRALVSGRISNIFIENGQFVNIGDTLLEIQSEKLVSQHTLLLKQKQEITNYIDDLKKLVILKASTFNSDKYQGDYFKFKEQVNEIKNKRSKAKKELDRNIVLYKQEFISQKEIDDLKFKLSLIENEYNITVTNQLSIWKSDLSKYKSSLEDIQSKLEQIVKEQEYYIVKSPVTGNIEQFNGIYKGSVIQAGQVIAGISPEADLIAEVYVSPMDIGYLKRNGSLSIQVDAFNYNEWGIIKGHILDISDDYLIIENQPVFKIRCQMENKFLTLKNGVRGDIKKGMTIRARFLIAERSLYQLLFDNVNDWLNPIQNENMNDNR